MLMKRYGGNGNDQLILRYPTPESVYQFYPMPSGVSNKCVIGCPQTHCLYDICMTTYMDQNHFPIVRSISVPIAESDKHHDFKLRYGYMIIISKRRLYIISGLLPFLLLLRDVSIEKLRYKRKLLLKLKNSSVYTVNYFLINSKYYVH